jgi:hypothetical protein
MLEEKGPNSPRPEWAAWPVVDISEAAGSPTGGPLQAPDCPLAAADRELFRLWLDGLTTAEIADRTGLTPDAVRDRMGRGLDDLRRALAAG